MFRVKLIVAVEGARCDVFKVVAKFSVVAAAFDDFKLNLFVTIVTIFCLFFLNFVYISTRFRLKHLVDWLHFHAIRLLQLRSHRQIPAVHR